MKVVKNKGLLAVIVVLFIGLGFVTADLIFGLSGGSSIVFSGKKGKVISWPDLMGLNTETGELSAKMEGVKGSLVRVPGFVVPLSDNMAQFKEFLLVPDPMACIHAPPPPPNQMVFVKLDKPMSIELSFGPVWVQGPLDITETQSQYGRVGYQIEGARVSPYKWKSK